MVEKGELSEGFVLFLILSGVNLSNSDDVA